jgi:hypothetical protein
MLTANVKQASRALAIVAAAEQLRDGLAGLQSIAFQTSLDGVTLTGVDTTTVLSTAAGAGVISTPTLGYTTGAALDQLVAAVAQLGTNVATTEITGTSTTIAQAIAAVCGS